VLAIELGLECVLDTFGGQPISIPMVEEAFYHPYALGSSVAPANMTYIFCRTKGTLSLCLCKSHECYWKLAVRYSEIRTTYGTRPSNKTPTPYYVLAVDPSAGALFAWINM